MIYSAKGDIADIAPMTADAAVLWMRSGFNMRCATWDFKIANEGHRLQLVIDPAVKGTLLVEDRPYRRPWEAPVDSLWEFDPMRNRLRYLYVYSNPTDSFGYQNLQEVGKVVHRALNCLAQLNEVRNVAFIHIPYRGERQFPTREDGAASGQEMVRAIEQWSHTHPGRLNSFLLVDLKDDFASLAPPYPPGG